MGQGVLGGKQEREINAAILRKSCQGIRSLPACFFTIIIRHTKLVQSAGDFVSWEMGSMMGREWGCGDVEMWRWEMGKRARVFVAVVVASPYAPSYFISSCFGIRPDYFGD